MPDNMAKKCKFIKKDGSKCNAYALSGSDYCLSHDPKAKKVKLEAVRRGGASESYKKLNLRLPPVEVKTPFDVCIAVNQTINELRAGEIPPKVANTIGYLLGISLKAFDISEIDKKLEVLDRVILERRSRKS